MPEPIATVTFAGHHVRLEPLSQEHVADLVVAANEDRSTFEFTVVPPDAERMRRYVDGLLADHAACRGLPFAQRRLDTGDVVGCTRYLDPHWWRGRPEPDEVEVGGTWLAASAQRTAINTEAKLLLLAHAFERLGVWRVAICTDARNARSRDAILRIGASFEGLLRSYRTRADAPAPRDTAMYSVIAEEWPDVRSRLTAMLAGAP